MVRSRLWPALLTGGLLFVATAATADGSPPPVPETAKKKLVGLPPDCQKAYAAMRACLEKTIAAGAPESIRPQWERQLDDTLDSWQALKGQPGLVQVCREIAANPDCSE